MFQNKAYQFKTSAIFMRRKLQHFTVGGTVAPRSIFNLLGATDLQLCKTGIPKQVWIYPAPLLSELCLEKSDSFFSNLNSKLIFSFPILF